MSDRHCVDISFWNNELCPDECEFIDVKVDGERVLNKDREDVLLSDWVHIMELAGVHVRQGGGHTDRTVTTDIYLRKDVSALLERAHRKFHEITDITQKPSDNIIMDGLHTLSALLRETIPHTE